MKLTHLQPALTPERDWIVTKLKSQIIEQLKPNVLTAQIPSVVLELDGGVLKLGAATVEASAYWEPKLQAGKHYLVFCETRRSPVNDFIAYEIDRDGRLRNTDPRFDPQDDIDNLDGVIWAEARKIILAAPPRGRITGMMN